MTLSGLDLPVRYKNRLKRAGLASIQAVVDGLATGATASAIGALSNSHSRGVEMYFKLVDGLVSQGYDVGVYKHRIVSGVS